MAQQTTTPLEQVEGRVRKSYADINAWYNDGMDAVVASNNAWMKGCQEMANEVLSFSQGQLKDGFDVSQRLATSPSFDDAARVQAEYVQTSLQAYADEYKKLGAMAETMVKDVLAPIKGQADAVASRMTAPPSA